MSNVQEFLNNPPDFMRHNVVVFCGQAPSREGGGSQDFLLVPVSRISARYRGNVLLGASNKKDAGYFEIRAANATALSDEARRDGEPFQAIWGGFQAGGKIKCDLGATGPGLMLTPELSGCAIAFTAGGGTASFSHYNLKDGTQTLSKEGMVSAASSDYSGFDSMGILAKEDYRAKAKDSNMPLYVNVIGWRGSNGQWTFWAQYIEDKNSVRQIRGVEQLRPGSFSSI